VATDAKLFSYAAKFAQNLIHGSGGGAMKRPAPGAGVSSPGGRGSGSPRPAMKAAQKPKFVREGNYYSQNDTKRQKIFSLS